MSINGIAEEFLKYKIWKLDDGRLFVDGLYLTAIEARLLAEWIQLHFKREGYVAK